MTKSKVNLTMESELRRIAEFSNRDPRYKYNCLMPHFNKENLISCYHELDGTKAVGVDKQTKEEYGENLNENIERLVKQMKEMEYLPGPVRQVMIPKGDGKSRPLGISNFEDKVIQLMFGKILEAIYEPIFYNFSYGFRRGRSCHDAIKALHQNLTSTWPKAIIDVDLQNFFGEINHQKLIKILEMKIQDKRFIRYIVRMLKSGILSEGELTISDQGTAQGSVCSPILANVFAHYCLDQWFETIKPRLYGNASMYRYADDLVIVCSNLFDVHRIKKALTGRVERFSLKINETKTKIVKFNKGEFYRDGTRQETFDFLSFTFYLEKNKKRNIQIKIKTARKKFMKKVKEFKTWIMVNRNKHRLGDLWKSFCAKLRGHFNYFGVSYNSRYIEMYRHLTVKIFFKWINRRSQRRSFKWDKFNLFMKKYPLPLPKISHSLLYYKVKVSVVSLVH